MLSLRRVKFFSLASLRGGACSHHRLNGEGGIRTRGTGVHPYDGLANRCLQPLGHLSGFIVYIQMGGIGTSSSGTQFLKSAPNLQLAA
jgi:hypothetical protein